MTTALLGLAAQLREETREDHERAEGSGYMEALTSGRLSRDGYAALAAQLHAVYAALEAATGSYRDDPLMRDFVMPELTRLPSLEVDLVYLAGPDWRELVEVTDGGRAYAARIAEIGSTWAGGFLAHHYVRYLGDLSGGQILKRRLGDAYGLDRDGLTFFDFDQIPKPKVFKDRYRELLNSMPWDETERGRVVEEARLAFRFNTSIFADLGAQMDRWVVAPA